MEKWKKCLEQLCCPFCAIDSIDLEAPQITSLQNQACSKPSAFLILFLAVQHSTDEKKWGFVSSAYKFISKYLLQIPVIIFEKKRISSSLKILILFKNYISHKTSRFQLTLITQSLETDMRSTAYLKYLLFILVLLMKQCLKHICSKKSPSCSSVFQVHKINVIASGTVLHRFSTIAFHFNIQMQIYSVVLSSIINIIC